MARLTLIARHVPGIGYVPISVWEDHIYTAGKGCSCGEERWSLLVDALEFEFHGIAEDIYQGV